jgi:hypothetical protein
MIGHTHTHTHTQSVDFIEQLAVLLVQTLLNRTRTGIRRGPLTETPAVRCVWAHEGL